MTSAWPTTDDDRSVRDGSARAAVAAGWARVRDRWRAVGVAYLASLGLALPLAAALAASLRQSLAHREAAARMLAGWDGLWHRSFAAQAQGLERTLDPGVVGIGAVLRGLDDLVTGTLLDLPPPILAAGLLYLVGWVLLSGGLLARFRGDAGGVVSLGASHFRRILAITAVGWLGWAVVLGWLLPALEGLMRPHMRDVIDERVVAAWIVAKHACVWILVLAIRVVIDQAKVVAVDDPARSPWAALRVGISFCRRRALAVLAVVGMLGAVSLGLLLLTWLVAPGVGQRNGLQILVAFAIGQLSVIARVTMRAWSLASAQALWHGTHPRR